MTLDPRITFTRASTATYYNSAGVLTTAAVNGPRFDYDPVTLQPRGLLVEEARTMNAFYTEDFADPLWTKTGCTVTANQIASPDGATTADLITATASPATVGWNTSSGGGNYVISFFVKRGTTDWVYLLGQATDSPRAWFNINTITLGTRGAGLIDSGIQNVGNGWLRVWIADAIGSGAEPTTIGLSDADNSTTVTAGKTVYLWGAQNEHNGVFPTSYMAQAGSAANRAADVAVMTSTNFSSWYNASAGTFVAEFDLLEVASGTRPAVSADNNSTSERILIYGNGTDPKVTITDGGAAQADLDAGTIAAATTYKFAVSFAANDVAACLNGGTVVTDVAATMPTPTQLRLGFDGTNYLSGHLRKLKFFNIAKSDADLQTLTT